MAKVTLIFSYLTKEQHFPLVVSILAFNLCILASSHAHQHPPIPYINLENKWFCPFKQIPPNHNFQHFKRRFIHQWQRYQAICFFILYNYIYIYIRACIKRRISRNPALQYIASRNINVKLYQSSYHRQAAALMPSSSKRANPFTCILESSFP